MADRSRRQVKKNQDLQRILYVEKERSQLKQLRQILKKTNRTDDEIRMLEEFPHLVLHIQKNIARHASLKEREKEIVDDPDVFAAKCAQLAKALKESSSAVVYTGAGISTSAHIPDYRGPQGVWTLLQKGQAVAVQDLSLAEPTFTHMALEHLRKEGFIKHIVSQNCDGLHLRAGTPSTSLSELHGNMFIEVCPKCKPFRQYVRLFDVTEKTGLHKHSTGRRCHKCRSDLKDTIVHFGEKGTIPWPLNWKGAIHFAQKSDLILCLGTSLKVLRRYPELWEKKSRLFIVNLQWTPKDSQAELKIHGKCDDVLKQVLTTLELNACQYKRNNDPIFNLATTLKTEEFNTMSRLMLSVNQVKQNMHLNPERELENSSSKPHLSNAEIPKLDFRDKDDEKIDSKDFSQPYIMLYDIAQDLAKFQETSTGTYLIKDKISDSQSPGWFGKGCAKWRRRKGKKDCANVKISVH